MLSGQASAAQVTLMVEITHVVRACWVFIQEALSQHLIMIRPTKKTNRVTCTVLQRVMGNIRC